MQTVLPKCDIGTQQQPTRLFSRGKRTFVKVGHKRNLFGSHNGSHLYTENASLHLNETNECVHMHICSCMHVCMGVSTLNDYVHFVSTYLCTCTNVCVCAAQRPHRGLKPLRGVYTNTLTKDTSCCLTACEIYLPDSLEHLGLFKRKQAKDSRRSRTQNCCHIAALNPQLVSLRFCECGSISAYALWWKQTC